MFLQAWNLQGPWVKLCFTWFFITACPLLPRICPSWNCFCYPKSRNFCVAEMLGEKKKKVTEVVPPPPGQGVK